MSERVTMPALGESVTEGTVTRWLKQVGDTIAVDEPLVEVSTDKVDTEIPSPVAGTIVRILVAEDETAEVGSALVEIGTAEEAAQGGASPAAEQPATPDAPAAEPEPAVQAAPSVEQPAPEHNASPSTAPSAGDGEGEKVAMPALGESVTEGTVTRWLKKEGDTVAVDEPLLEVSTDKVDTEIPSPVAGVLTSILVQEDETAEVGAALAIIGGSTSAGSSSQASSGAQPSTPVPAAESAQAPVAAAPPAPAAPAPQTPPAPPAPTTPAPAPTTPAPGTAAATPAPQAPQSASEDRGENRYATPLVRKLAAELGVNLADVKGSGNAGRIRKQDVLAAAQPAASAQPAANSMPPASSHSGAAAQAAVQPLVPSPKRGTVEPMSRMRKVIAQRMVESLQVSAQLTTVLEVDVTRIAQLRAKHKAEFLAREGVKLTYMPFFMLAAVEALKMYPMVNASVDGDSIVYHAEENLSVAVDTDRGLMVPVIRDAGNLNLAGLAKKTADLAERTRTQKITPDEMAGGTFTITNTGSRGALFDTPIINQPQVGILGTGAVVKRPVVMADADGGETIAIRSMVYLALSYDHRIVDGADAARFLSAMKVRLEEGSFEV